MFVTMDSEFPFDLDTFAGSRQTGLLITDRPAGKQISNLSVVQVEAKFILKTIQVWSEA